MSGGLNPNDIKNLTETSRGSLGWINIPESESGSIQSRKPVIVISNKTLNQCSSIACVIPLSINMDQDNIGQFDFVFGSCSDDKILSASKAMCSKAGFVDLSCRLFKSCGLVSPDVLHELVKRCRCVLFQDEYIKAIGHRGDRMVRTARSVTSHSCSLG